MDVRLVILGTVMAISLVQYISWWTSYNAAIRYALSQPRYKTKVCHLVSSQGGCVLTNENVHLIDDTDVIGP